MDFNNNYNNHKNNCHKNYTYNHKNIYSNNNKTYLNDVSSDVDSCNLTRTNLVVLLRIQQLMNQKRRTEQLIHRKDEDVAELERR